MTPPGMQHLRIRTESGHHRRTELHGSGSDTALDGQIVRVTVPENNEHRARFLQAGAMLLEDAPAAIAMRALTVRAITRRAARSTGAFYHYWETQAEFILELIPHVLLRDATEEVATNRAALKAASVRFDAAAIFQVFEDTCAALISSPANRMQHLLWSLPDDDIVLRALRETYRVYQQSYVGLYEAMFLSTNAELIDGVTFEDLTVMITALFDGLSMRRRIEPEVADAQTGQRMIASLLLGVMAPRGASVQPWAVRVDTLLRGAQPSP